MLQTMEIWKSQEVIDFYIYDFLHFLHQYHTAALNQLMLYLSVNVL